SSKRIEQDRSCETFRDGLVPLTRRDESPLGTVDWSAHDGLRIRQFVHERGDARAGLIGMGRLRLPSCQDVERVVQWLVISIRRAAELCQPAGGSRLPGFGMGRTGRSYKRGRYLDLQTAAGRSD